MVLPADTLEFLPFLFHQAIHPMLPHSRRSRWLGHNQGRSLSHFRSNYSTRAPLKNIRYSPSTGMNQAFFKNQRKASFRTAPSQLRRIPHESVRSR